MADLFSHASSCSLTPELLSSQPERWLAQKEENSSTPLYASALIGQERALLALSQSMRSRSSYGHAYLALPAGIVVSDVLQETAQLQQWPVRNQCDWVYLANPDDPHAPLCISLPLGSAEPAITGLWELLNQPIGNRKGIADELRKLYPSTPFSHYLELIENKAFEDLPGNELANIIVTHKQEAPGYVFCDRVTADRLFGDIRLQSVEGTVSAELHLIRPGAILKANGGTLVIDAAELLQDPKLWRQLKHALRQKRFEWPQPGEGQTAVFYEPEPVPLDLKVILTGPSYLFNQLDELDPDFSNFFPYIADFTASVNIEKITPSAYLSYLSYVQNKTGHRDLEQSGLHALLRYASSLCEHQYELCLDTVRLMQLLEEADAVANDEHSSMITAQHIHEVEKRQRFRGSRIAEMSWQNILEQQIQIDTSGTTIGQINGLTVVTMAGAEFGEPSRITATVHYGDGDIIDIERKSELSGSIHTKGVMILTAYLANLFAQRDPMPLSATLVFEQSYHEVDGDSASLAELCCLLSALGEQPIRQSIAVTGAIDQFGNVQAVGGINEKISGYFKICERRGLDGSHGVIVPLSNRLNLHLPQNIIKAVENGLFNVYAVKHVTEAVELLMGVECGDPGSITEQTLFGRIRQRLKDFHDDERPRHRSLFSRWFGTSD
ncbi:Lon protease family protein [Aliidiomarina celeris]|uniref:Lon protease family protein n=1 Tax=Aliidiomarina celeris TaxID=2249428 RepID=UPI000DEA139D|nr:Lon protease family protein [Aliidiomarina celeris]